MLEGAWTEAAQAFEVQLTLAKTSIEDLIDNGTTKIDEFLKKNLQNKWNY